MPWGACRMLTTTALSSPALVSMVVLQVFVNEVSSAHWEAAICGRSVEVCRMTHEIC